MRLTLLLLSAHLTAAYQKLLPRLDSNITLGLELRSDDCHVGSTCAECFGAGNIICDTYGCFNPSKHEQCCKGYNVCVGKDTSCCVNAGGPGKIGSSGVPSPPPSATTSGSGPKASSWTCSPSESGEECCQKGHTALHWCSGEYPKQQCYNPRVQFCCTDGSVCYGKDCCDLFSASPTNPLTAQNTDRATTSFVATQTQTQAGSESESATGSAQTSTKTGEGNRVTTGGLGVVMVVAMMVLG